MSRFFSLSLLLDGGLEGAQTVKEGSSFQDMAWQLMLGLGLFLLLMYVVYLLYKYLLPGRGKKAGFGFNKNKHMKVLEITSVGPGSTIQLVRVSEEYFLIGVTKNQITFLTRTSPPPGGGEAAPAVGTAFDSILNRFRKTKDHEDVRESDNNGNKDIDARTDSNGK